MTEIEQVMYTTACLLKDMPVKDIKRSLAFTFNTLDENQKILNLLYDMPNVRAKFLEGLENEQRIIKNVLYMHEDELMKRGCVCVYE